MVFNLFNTTLQAHVLAAMPEDSALRFQDLVAECKDNSEDEVREAKARTSIFTQGIPYY
jgi:hypothetical protein